VCRNLILLADCYRNANWFILNKAQPSHLQGFWHGQPLSSVVNATKGQRSLRPLSGGLLHVLCDTKARADDAAGPPAQTDRGRLGAIWEAIEPQEPGSKQSSLPMRNGPRVKFACAVASRFDPRRLDQIFGLLENPPKVAATPIC
jgi:hypothetical protein